MTTGRAETETDVVGRFGGRIKREFLLIVLIFSVKCEVRLSSESEKRRERSRGLRKEGKVERKFWRMVCVVEC